MGHYFAAQPYRQAAPEDDIRRERPRSRPPARDAIFRAMGELFERDLKNVEAGYYPLPNDDDGGLLESLRRSRMFFADVPVSAERKASRRGAEVYSPELAERLPAYFLQNFHYQTGGYLTEESATLYDMQVEVLFSGTANAMRRQCLVPIAEWMRGKDQRKVSAADIACGTGRFLKFLKQTWPRLKATGVDLSESYLEEARRHLHPYTDVELLPGNAERLPFPDASMDIVTSVYLFHEVPPKIRRIIAAEFARVLKPGGRLVFMDSLQRGDTPDFDALLEGFPLNFHEPYYPSYVGEDLPKMFCDAGLTVRSSVPAFLSKLVVADKPL
jgi:ubiquinone/menaquinone biosynthesis C-methylase UbiE